MSALHPASAEARWLDRTGWLAARLDALPPVSVEMGKYFASREQRDRAVEQLADELRADFGATIYSGWDGARIRMLGITSTSTGGLSGAMRNWRRAAVLKARALPAPNP